MNGARLCACGHPLMAHFVPEASDTGHRACFVFPPCGCERFRPEQTCFLWQCELTVSRAEQLERLSEGVPEKWVYTVDVQLDTPEDSELDVSAIGDTAKACARQQAREQGLVVHSVTAVQVDYALWVDTFTEGPP